jgi:Methyltransferase domain
MDLVEKGEGVARRHPWEQARTTLVLRILAQCGATGSTRVLDVGAGDTWLAQQLLAELPDDAVVTCWDVNYRGDDLADPSIPERMHLTAERPDARFDGILLLDVLEHVSDDVDFVRAVVADSLDEGGWVLVTVPAYQWLFTTHDDALHHLRRYSPARCRSVLWAADLHLEREGSLFTSLLLPRMTQALRERTLGPARDAERGISHWGGGPRLTRTLTVALEVEGRLALAVEAAGIRIPGLSYWACCRRAG